ncbi:stress responsive protein [Rhizobium sp. R635]|uniref:Dabb family protein n=1 Tax=unclassified Rhizobium TaxID=2613769 RepID=UPI000B52DAD9|nr:Dabb family protein [Rhizobium sp. R635]OWV88085.1 stress responsive protein [Rhizobium sp. R635]
MIRHIVFFTVPEEHLEEVRAGLSILTGIPYARLLEIGTNVKTDQLGTEIDLVVYGEFDDEAALAAYKAHPDYQLSIERVRPLREKRIAADYDSSAAVKRAL